MTWQPIETAPKYGESILLGNADEVAEGFWTGKKWVLVGGDYWNVRAFYNQPTHWMPLPEPPKEEVTR
jgi:hypothetical protein